jgi:hypothetical protein
MRPKTSVRPLHHSLIKININKIINFTNEFAISINDYDICLKPEYFNGQIILVLFCNGVRTPQSWLVTSSPHKGRIIGHLKTDEVFYIHSPISKKRHRYIFIDPKTNKIGCAPDFAVRYACQGYRSKYLPVSKGEIKKSCEQLFKDDSFDAYYENKKRQYRLLW